MGYGFDMNCSFSSYIFTQAEYVARPFIIKIFQLFL